MTIRTPDTARAGAEKTALFLLAFMALNALPAGILLVLRPDGSWIGLQPSLLAGTPFPDSSFRAWPWPSRWEAPACSPSCSSSSAIPMRAAPSCLRA